MCWRSTIKGIFSRAEIGVRLLDFITPENATEVLERLAPDLVSCLKGGVAYDACKAADDECLGLPGIAEYYRRVGSTLLEPGDFKNRGLLSVVSLPSFQVEWALRLLATKQSGHALLLTQAEEIIWGSRAGSAIPVRRVEAAISSDLADWLLDSWRKMLRHTRHPRVRGLGLGGVDYHFAYDGMAGKTWSPDRDTAPGKLVDLSHTLRAYALAEGSERDPIAEELRRQLDWFRRLA